MLRNLASDPDNVTTVLQAAKENRPDVLKNLIDEGKSIDEKGHCDQTALHYAAIKGHTECVVDKRVVDP